MKTILVAYRVTDLERSVGFYRALGYIEFARVPAGDNCLVLLKFPDEPWASLELVHRPGDAPLVVGNGFDHLAIEVDALADTLQTLTAAGLAPEPIEYPGGPDGPMTSWLTDPDGYRVELVQWPPGQPGGVTDPDAT